MWPKQHCSVLETRCVDVSLGNEVTHPGHGQNSRLLRGIARAKPLGDREMVQAVLWHPSKAVRGAQNDMCDGQVWIERDRIG